MHASRASGDGPHRGPCSECLGSQSREAPSVYIHCAPRTWALAHRYAVSRQHPPSGTQTPTWAHPNTQGIPRRGVADTALRAADCSHRARSALWWVHSPHMHVHTPHQLYSDTRGILIAYTCISSHSETRSEPLQTLSMASIPPATLFHVHWCVQPQGARHALVSSLTLLPRRQSSLPSTSLSPTLSSSPFPSPPLALLPSRPPCVHSQLPGAPSVSRKSPAMRPRQHPPNRQRVGLPSGHRDSRFSLHPSCAPTLAHLSQGHRAFTPTAPTSTSHGPPLQVQEDRWRL